MDGVTWTDVAQSAVAVLALGLGIYNTVLIKRQKPITVNQRLHDHRQRLREAAVGIRQPLNSISQEIAIVQRFLFLQDMEGDKPRARCVTEPLSGLEANQSALTQISAQLARLLMEVFDVGLSQRVEKALECLDEVDMVLDSVRGTAKSRPLLPDYTDTDRMYLKRAEGLVRRALDVSTTIVEYLRTEDAKS